MIQPMIKHFKTIFRHKVIVCRECIACGETWRGLMHDNSKFGLTEFVPSAKHFQGNRSPIEAEKDETGYSIAWQHHMGHNPHHWEYWIDFDSQGHIIANKIPYSYVVEMVCDWVGAGKVYAQGKWKQNEPFDYYNKVRAGRHFHPETEALLVKFLECIRDNGLDEFHRMARCQSGYSYLRVDYEGLMIP